MRYFLAILALATAVLGANIQKSEISENTKFASENARVFSQEDQLFPARYFYPAYPEYVDSRYPSYNGQLVPAPSSQNQISSWSAAWTKLIPITSFALLYGAKAGIYLFSIMLILIVGVVLTTSICTFTPICTISFPAFALTKNQVKEQVAELARNYITPENLNAATVLVQKAVDKYTNIQIKENEENTKVPPTTTIQPVSSTQTST